MFDRPRIQLYLLVGLVFLSLTFVLPSVAKYHGDECFYTDAAIRMLQTGDYFTPYSASGTLRFAKPILPYWGVLGGYLLFGVNFFASRVAFLFAGCLVILFTYYLSLVLFDRKQDAILAALIIASNVQLLTISIRSTPDAFLTLFVLLSLIGFAQLLFRGDTSWKNYALAYCGAACAIETRGLPGVGVVAFPFLYCWLFRRGKTRLAELLEWKAVLLGTIIALGWFGLMLHWHGGKVIKGFYIDQVDENITGYRPLATLKNLQVYLLGVFRHFLPWSALLALAIILNRRVTATFWRAHRDESVFLVGWLGFILGAFMFGSYYRTRYMIVAYPTLAVWLAALLARHFEDDKTERTIHILLAAAGIVMSVAGLGLLATGLIVDKQIAGAGCLLLAAGVTAWCFLQRERRRDYGWIIAGLTLTAFLSIELFLRPVFSQSPTRALANRLRTSSNGSKSYSLNLSPAFQAQLRVFTGGTVNVTAIRMESGKTFPLDGPLILSEDDKASISETAGRLEQVGFASRRWRPKDFLALFDASKRHETFERNRIPYYILYPAELDSKRSNGSQMLNTK